MSGKRIASGLIISFATSFALVAGFPLVAQAETADLTARDTQLSAVVDATTPSTAADAAATSATSGVTDPTTSDEASTTDSAAEKPDSPAAGETADKTDPTPVTNDETGSTDSTATTGDTTSKADSATTDDTAGSKSATDVDNGSGTSTTDGGQTPSADDASTKADASTDASASSDTPAITNAQAIVTPASTSVTVDRTFDGYSYYLSSNGASGMLRLTHSDSGASLAAGDNALDQAWTITKNGNYYFLRDSQTGRALRVANGSAMQGPVLSLMELNVNDSYQRWSLCGSEGQWAFKSVGLSGTISYYLCGGVSLSMTSSSAGKDIRWALTEWHPTISDGYYQISSGVGNSQVLDRSGYNGIESSVQSSTSNGSSGQRWYVSSSNGSSSYSIRNLDNGYYLTGSLGGVVISNSWGNASLWNLSYACGIGYLLVNNTTGRALYVENGNPASGTKIVTVTGTPTSAQAWSFAVKTFEGNYTLAPKSSPTNNLDISGDTNLNGSNVVISIKSEADSQVWHIENLGNGYYRLVSCASGKALDAGGTANGSNVTQKTKDGSTSQQWIFTMGKYGLALVSRDGNKMLDVSGSGTASGTNVDIWTANDSSGQSWILTTSSIPYVFDYVDTFADYMTAYAKDDSHGYDQEYRWGQRGDYDCSSLVITCLRLAGFETGDATYTGDMRAALTSLHWEWITNFDVGSLQKGDILLRESTHTAAMISAAQLAQASQNEFNGATGGQPGDQTGKEVNIRDYNYNYPWDGILRATSKSVRS